MADGSQNPISAAKPRQTDFEAQTHDALLEMIEGTNAESAAQLAKKLSAAASTITRVGEGMKAHMTRVVWEGEGGQAFRDWGHEASMATLELGKYSEGAALVLEQVATAIAQAKAAVPKKDGSLETREQNARELLRAAMKDPGAGANAEIQAQKQLSTAVAAQERRRLEAADQLRKLAQTYTHSGQRIQSMPVPKFPPPPGQFVPAATAQLGSRQVASSDSTGRYITSSDEVAAQSNRPQSRTVEPVGPARPSTTVSPSVDVPAGPVDMKIDSVNTLPPPVVTTPQTPIGPAPSTPRPDGLGPYPVGTVPPTFSKGPVPVNSPGQTGGRPPLNGRSPAFPGQGPLGSSPVGRTPNSNGIVGGRPVTPTTGRPMGGIPRGTVIGGEPMGRGMAGMPHGAGAGMTGGQNGFAAGRRLASESGGVVGGRAQSGSASGRTFTPGGSGLVRNAPGGTNSGGSLTGRAGGSGTAKSPDDARRERQGDRPDYLTEDEETWLGGRRIVPPVID